MKLTTEQLESLKHFIEAGDAGMIRYFVDMLKIQVDSSHPIISAIYKSRNLDAGQKHGIAMSMIKIYPKPKNEETQMNLTTEQLKQIIREELMEVYKGKYKFYAPGPVALTDKEKQYVPYGNPDGSIKYRVPLETGAYAVPESPYDQIDPEVRSAIPADSDREALVQAYELSDVMGSKPELDLEDFLYAAERSNNPELVIQDAIDKIDAEMKKIEAEATRQMNTVGVGGVHGSSGNEIAKRFFQLRKAKKILKHTSLGSAYRHSHFRKEM